MAKPTNQGGAKGGDCSERWDHDPPPWARKGHRPRGRGLGRHLGCGSFNPDLSGLRPLARRGPFQGGEMENWAVLSPSVNLMRRRAPRVSAGTVKRTSPALLESPATSSFRPESGEWLTPPAGFQPERRVPEVHVIPAMVRAANRDRQRHLPPRRGRTRASSGSFRGRPPCTFVRPAGPPVQPALSAAPVAVPPGLAGPAGCEVRQLGVPPGVAAGRPPPSNTPSCPVPAAARSPR